jgi:hypothetical protein
VGVPVGASVSLVDDNGGRGRIVERIGPLVLLLDGSFVGLGTVVSDGLVSVELSVGVPRIGPKIPPEDDD